MGLPSVQARPGDPERGAPEDRNRREHEGAELHLGEGVVFHPRLSRPAGSTSRW